MVHEFDLVLHLQIFIQQQIFGGCMPERRTIKTAQKAKRLGKSALTQASAFVKEAIDHVRKGKHGAKNAKQAIAIGLSEARRSGVAIPDKASKAAGRKKTTKKSAAKSASSKKSTSRISAAGKTASKKSTASSATGRKPQVGKASSASRASTGRIVAKKTSPKRSAAALKRLKGEPTNSVSHAALSRHAKAVAHTRSKADLHASAMKGARTRAKHAR
jgi:hypothetical protein